MEHTKEYVIAKNFRAILLARLAESCEYDSWSDEFSRKEQIAIWKRNHTKIDPNNLTTEELNELGFSVWGENLRLIPLWVKPIIDPKVMVECIDSEIIEFGKLDNDNRFGLMAGGIRK